MKRSAQLARKSVHVQKPRDVVVEMQVYEGNSDLLGDQFAVIRFPALSSALLVAREWQIGYGDSNAVTASGYLI